MTRKFSTGLRDMLNSKAVAVGGSSITGDTIAWASGTPDKLHASAGSFVTNGFAVGDIIMVSGFAAAANNGLFTVTVVEAADLSVSETSATTEAEGVHVKVQCVKGGSFADIFKDGVLYVYSGAQPTDADQAYNGTLLATFTVDAGTWAAGSAANGLRFGASAAGVVSKSASQAWQSVVAASGTAGWFRLCANATDACGASTSLPRVDGSVGTSGAQLVMSSTTFTASATLTIDTFTVTLSA